MLLNNSWITEGIEEKIKKYLNPDYYLQSSICIQI